MKTAKPFVLAAALIVSLAVLVLVFAGVKKAGQKDSPQAETETAAVTEEAVIASEPSEATETEEVSEETEALPETESEIVPEPVNESELMLEAMTLEQKVYQLFLVTPEMLLGEAHSTEAGEEVREVLRRKPVGGLLFF